MQTLLKIREEFTSLKNISIRVVSNGRAQQLALLPIRKYVEDEL
jgi:hypothetical protein